MQRFLKWMLMGLALGSWTGANAEIVTLTMPNKLVARAEFRQGDPGKPAVILIHGFLQTHMFPTVSRLTDSLASDGYTVLSPTLTLGVTHRNQSMACEAINTHTVADGVAEIGAWMKWLRSRKASRIVLAGHSLGNIYNLAYVSSAKGRPPVKLIDISIVEGSLKSGEASRGGLVRAMRDRSGRREVLENQFSFCQKYRSTARSLLSYLEWGPDQILAAIQKSRIPITMIMGSKDDRLGQDWLERLRQTRAKVVTIQGANHFMDGQYEFDLVEDVLSELKDI